jgi:hypothetical protein
VEFTIGAGLATGAALRLAAAQARLIQQQSLTAAQQGVNSLHICYGWTNSRAWSRKRLASEYRKLIDTVDRTGGSPSMRAKKSAPVGAGAFRIFVSINDFGEK